ncbi:MAG TPA: hypothetical protein VH120_07635 [Gemmataceae bacterium]|jgi:hypothetical protein|nr:hypothetical protein [Gemmataceae bacterium]
MATNDEDDKVVVDCSWFEKAHERTRPATRAERAAMAAHLSVCLKCKIKVNNLLADASLVIPPTAMPSQQELNAAADADIQDPEYRSVVEAAKRKKSEEK